MASLGMKFDSSQVPPNEGFDVLPAGDYRACITASEVKTTKDGAGKYVKLTFQLLDDPYKNRRLWENLNLWNKSQKAVKMSQGALSGISRAVGVLVVDDTSQLHNIPMIVRVKVNSDANGNKENRIAGYKPVQAGPAMPQPSFAPPQQAVPPQGDQRPFAGQQAPWGGTAY